MSLKRNTLWNLFGTVLPFLFGAITIPYLIKQIGIEAFGILTLVWGLIGYFSMFDFGLGRALTQQIASIRLNDNLAELPSLVKTGLGFMAVTGLAGGIVLGGLSNELALHWLGITRSLQTTTFHSLVIAALGIPITTVTTGLRGILEAYEEFRIVNFLRMSLGVANFGLPALSAMLIGDSLTWMVSSLVGARILVLVAHIWLVDRKLPNGWSSAKYSMKNTRRLFSFGAWMTISNIVSPIMVSADRFFISAVLGAGVVAYYTVPFEVLIRVLVLPGALTTALFPRLAVAIASDSEQARLLYRKCVKIVALTMLPICLLLALGSKFGLTLWLGADFAEHSWKIVSIMAPGLLLNGIAHVPFAAIQAAGDSRTTACLHLVELVFYIPLLYLLMDSFGLAGAAIAWTLRVAFDLVALLVYAEKKNF